MILNLYKLCQLIIIFHLDFKYFQSFIKHLCLNSQYYKIILGFLTKTPYKRKWSFYIIFT